MKYYQIKINHLAQKENGSIYKARKLFVVKDTGTTEAEARLMTLIKDEIQEYTVESITEANFSDVLIDKTKDYTYKVTIKYTSTDMDSGKEKVVKETFLAQANSIDEALLFTNSRLHGSVVNIEVIGVVKSNIDDVFLVVDKAEKAEANTTVAEFI